jgi:hypothetical protein
MQAYNKSLCSNPFTLSCLESCASWKAIFQINFKNSIQQVKSRLNPIPQNKSPLNNRNQQTNRNGSNQYLIKEDEALTELNALPLHILSSSDNNLSFFLELGINEEGFNRFRELNSFFSLAKFCILLNVI